MTVNDKELVVTASLKVAVGAEAAGWLVDPASGDTAVTVGAVVSAGAPVSKIGSTQ